MNSVKVIVAYLPSGSAQTVLKVLESIRHISPPQRQYSATTGMVSELLGVENDLLENGAPEYREFLSAIPGAFPESGRDPIHFVVHGVSKKYRAKARTALENLTDTDNKDPRKRAVVGIIPG